MVAYNPISGRKKVAEELGLRKNRDNILVEDAEATKDGKDPEPSAGRGTSAMKKEEDKLTERKANMNIAMGTSRINYMDPRITISWCKMKDVPIEKIF